MTPDAKSSAEELIAWMTNDRARIIASVEVAVERRQDALEQRLRYVSWASVAAVLVALFLSAIVFGIPFGVSRGLLGANTDRIAQINRERTRNTYAACLRANQQNATIVGFIVGNRQVPPEIKAQAVKTFVPRDCRQVTAEQVRAR